MTGTFAFVLISAFLTWFFLIGIQEQKKIQTVHDYLIFGRNMPGKYFTWTLLATNVSLSSVFIGLAAAGYVYGYASLWIIISWCAGMYVFWRFYNRVFEFFRTGKTLHEFLEVSYNSSDLRQVAAFFTIVAFVSTVGIEFYAGFVLLSAFGLPMESKAPLVFLMTFVCSLYTAIGGFPSVARTDRIQFVVIIVGSVFLVFALYLTLKYLWASGLTFPKWENLKSKGFLSDPLAIVGFLVLFLPFLISAMDSWQRCVALAGRDNARAIVKKGLVVGAVGFVVVYVIPILFGISTLTDAFGTHLAQNQVLFTPILTVFHLVSPIFRALAYAAILLCFIGAMLSTAGTLLITAVYSLIYDILAVRQGVNFDSLSESQHQKLVGVSQIWVIIFGFVAGAVSFLGLSLQDLIFAFFSAQIVIAVPLLVAAYRPNFARGRSVSALASLCFGFCAPIVLVLVAKKVNVPELKDIAPIAGFGIGCFAFVLLCWIKQAEEGP